MSKRYLVSFSIAALVVSILLVAYGFYAGDVGENAYLVETKTGQRIYQSVRQQYPPTEDYCNSMVMALYHLIEINYMRSGTAPVGEPVPADFYRELPDKYRGASLDWLNSLGGLKDRKVIVWKDGSSFEARRVGLDAVWLRFEINDVHDWEWDMFLVGDKLLRDAHALEGKDGSTYAFDGATVYSMEQGCVASTSEMPFPHYRSGYRVGDGVAAFITGDGWIDPNDPDPVRELWLFKDGEFELLGSGRGFEVGELSEDGRLLSFKESDGPLHYWVDSYGEVSNPEA